MADESNTNKTSEQILRDNHVYSFSGRVDMVSCKQAMEWVLAESIEDRNAKLTMIITSYGGSVDPVFGLIDVMLNVPCPIRTVAAGAIVSAGFMLFLAGDDRVVTKNTSIMCHQFSAWFGGKEHDVVAYGPELDRLSKAMVRYISKRTGMAQKKVKETLLGPTDCWLSAKEAVKLGIAHRVVSSFGKL